MSSDMNGTLNHAPNLTQRPPDSPRLRPGGYVVLARILDKGRAEIAGTAGEYKYNNPIDHHWFRFTGLSAEALKAELATGKGDGEMLAWDRPERSPQARSVGDSTAERLPQRTRTGWRRGDARVFHEASRRHK